MIQDRVRAIPTVIVDESRRLTGLVDLATYRNVIDESVDLTRGALGMADDTTREWQHFFQLGYEAQMAGRLDEALQHYRHSIAIHATAEAHTFLGWALSYLGRHEDAIAECKVAISIDPDFGNPYNDIGAYLIELNREEDAIAWLERAKTARRYEPRHYPYFNLARVHIRRHRIYDAIRELKGAIAIEPGYTLARRELHRLLGMLN